MFLVTVFLKICIIVTLCLLYVSLQLFTRLLPNIGPRGRLGGLGGKVGSACGEFEDNEGGVSASFGASLPGFPVTLLVRSSDP